MSLPLIASSIADVEMAAAQTILINYSVFFISMFSGFIFNGPTIIGHFIGKGNATKT